MCNHDEVEQKNGQAIIWGDGSEENEKQINVLYWPWGSWSTPVLMPETKSPNTYSLKLYAGNHLVMGKNI